MGIDSLLPEEQTDEIMNNPSQYTVSDLISMFGKGAVRRGISYMASLDEAEEEWRDSAETSDEYGKQFIESVKGEPESDEVTEKVQNDWEEGMKDGGLGIDE